MANPGTLHDWVEDLPARGWYTFSRADALSATDASPAAVKQSLYRLKKRKAIVSPRRDFFVVLPPAYRSVGCPPAPLATYRTTDGAALDPRWKVLVNTDVDPDL